MASDAPFNIDVTSLSTTSHIGDYNGFTYPSTNNMYWSYSTTVYKYQLNCPRCDTANWGAVDEIVYCKGKKGRKACGATLKAVTNTVDHEIEVG